MNKSYDWLTQDSTLRLKCDWSIRGQSVRTLVTRQMAYTISVLNSIAQKLSTPAAAMPVAIVTGSNKGIGFGIVRALCKKFNGEVYLTARDEARGLVIYA